MLSGIMVMLKSGSVGFFDFGQRRADRQRRKREPKGYRYRYRSLTAGRPDPGSVCKDCISARDPSTQLDVYCRVMSSSGV